ncbi:hypothetical protein D4Q71_16490 [Rhodopseudomonas palustris]|nr:hypothetical protein D4Q71_16490 [Rhodopseudomonas palustris]
MRFPIRQTTRQAWAVGPPPGGIFPPHPPPPPPPPGGAPPPRRGETRFASDACVAAASIRPFRFWRRRCVAMV